MPRSTRKKHPSPPATAAASEQAAVRIIGGKLRGRKLTYTTEPRTRPMKDRVREAVFDLLGPAVRGKHAIDLFAGTGALGLEALSRGATRATLVEQHFPTAALIRQNAEMLGVGTTCEVVAANALIWGRKHPAPSGQPWLVFCSPPYALYTERTAEMIALLRVMIERSPPQSMLVVESDQQFDVTALPHAAAWKTREYLPAVISIYTKPVEPGESPSDSLSLDEA